MEKQREKCEKYKEREGTMGKQRLRGEKRREGERERAKKTTGSVVKETKTAITSSFLVSARDSFLTYATSSLLSA